MFKTLRHIAPPIIALVLLMYSVSMLVCLDAECLDGENDGCAASIVHALQPDVRQNAQRHLLSDVQQNEALGKALGKTFEVASDACHTNNADASHICSCVCHTPALAQTAVATYFFVESFQYIAEEPSSFLASASRLFYRPPTA